MTIEEYILKNGPCLSSELIEFYGNKGTKTDAIRKRLSRVKEPIRRVGDFFKDRQLFFYHQDQLNQAIYFKRLRQALKTDAKRSFAIIVAIEYHNGFIHKDHLASYSYSPIEELRSHKTFTTVLNNLERLNIINYEDEGVTINEHFSSVPQRKVAYYKAIEFSKDIILEQFYTFTRSIGLVSFNSGKKYSEFSKLQFCFTAPSYVSGILEFTSSKPIPAFVLADILIGNQIGKQQIEFFVQKIEIVKSQTVSKFLPFLIVDNISQEALKFLKEKGVIVGFIDKLFGEDYKDLLSSLISTIANAGAVLKNNPEAYLTLIAQFDKLVDGKTNNLKGDIFELAVGYYYSNLCQNLEIGKILNYGPEKKEVDVLAFFQEKIIACECKAYKKEIELHTVEVWLTKKVPIIYKALATHDNGKQMHFEFWSTSGFTQDAIEFLEKKSKLIKKYSISYFGEDEILEKARKSKAKKITDIMRDYFIREV